LRDRVVVSAVAVDQEHRAPGDGDPGVGVEREMGAVLLERPEGHEQDPSRGAINLRPGDVREICHRVLNYRRRPPRGEENRMSITPDQLEETDVEPERKEDLKAAEPASEELVVEDLLVEDVSIDGMCGVY
jgi:mycofactocin precursor